MADKEKAATLEHVEAATPPMSLAAEASKTFDVAGLRSVVCSSRQDYI